MIRWTPITLTLLAALMLTALPSLAQPPADAAWLTINVLNTDGSPVTPPPSMTVVHADGTEVVGASQVQTTGNTVTWGGLTAGDYLLTLNNPATGMYATQTITIDAGANTLDWRLPKPATLTIKLTTADGQDVKKPPYLAITPLAVKNPNSYRMVSAAGNVVTVTNIYPAKYTITVVQSPTGAIDSREVDVQPGANTLDWALPPAASVTFYVTTLTGAVATGKSLSVTLSRANCNSIWSNAMPVTQDGKVVCSGTYVGDYTVVIRSQNGEIARQTVTLKPGDNTVNCTAPMLGSLTVHLLTHEGQSLAGLYPELLIKHLGDPIFVLGGGYSPNARDDRSYSDIPVGVYHATMSIANIGVIEERDLTVAPGDQSIEWRLPAFTTVTGALTADGKPATPTTGIGIVFRDNNGDSPPTPQASAVTFAAGRYTLTGVLPKSSQLILLTDAGWATAPLTVTTTTVTLDVPLTLQPGGALTFTNLPSFMKTPGSVVLICMDAGKTYPRLTLSADANGKIAIPSLPPGIWHYQTASRFLVDTVSGDVTIVAGSTQTIAGVPKRPTAGG